MKMSSSLRPVESLAALRGLQRFISRHVSSGSSAAQNNDQRAVIPSEAFAQVETLCSALAAELGVSRSSKRSKREKKRALEATVAKVVEEDAQENVVNMEEPQQVVVSKEEEEVVVRKVKKSKSSSSSRRGGGGGSLLLSTIAALLVIILPIPASGGCIMYEDCTNTQPVRPGQQSCRPQQRPVEIEPFDISKYPVRACPQFDVGCCTLDQNLLLYASLLQEKPLFGELADGGCPACYQNMQNFWCSYTCGPNQSDYLTIIGPVNMTSPENGEIYEVLHTRVSVNKAFACDTYSACESVKSVTQTSAMSNAEGFFNYQGQYEAIQHGAFIEFDLDSESPKALNPATYSCCSFPVDFNNASLGNTSCPCAYCKGMCPGNACAGANGGSDGLNQVSTPWYNGVNLVTICGAWGGVLGAILIDWLVRRYFFSASANVADEDSLVNLKSIPSFREKDADLFAH
jgi:hypothetical protein